MILRPLFIHLKAYFNLQVALHGVNKQYTVVNKCTFGEAFLVSYLV